MPMTRNDARSSVQIRKLTYSALYLAIALVLPFLTGQIPEIGSMLCPMHIPALLCLRLAVGTGGGICFPAAAVPSLWDAYGLYGGGHGV